MTDILPCPFCGIADLTLTVDRFGWKVVQCDDCGTSGPCIDLEGEQYIERWNARAPAQATPEPSAMTERLIQAAVDYEQAQGMYAAGARRELSDARAAIEAALALTSTKRVSQEALDWATSEAPAIEAFKAANPGWEKDAKDAREVIGAPLSCTERS